MTMRSCLALALVLVAAGCEEDAPAPEEGTAPVTAVDSTVLPAIRERLYERALVFATPERDSLILAAWVFEAETRPEGVLRSLRGWLHRGNAWDAFFADRWEAPPSRVPWRIVPRGPVRLVVGLEDAVERVVYEEGARIMEVTMEEPITDWSGQQGEVVQLRRASILLGGERLSGLALDLSRTRPADAVGQGDWGLLFSGDSLRIVLEDPDPETGSRSTRMRGWVRERVEQATLPEVTLDWAEVRAFEQARRDVPVSWTVATPGGELTGILEVRAPWITAGEGEDPVLPVDALFEIAGTVVWQDRTYPVRGLLRHRQR